MSIEVMPTAKDVIYTNAMQVSHTRDEFILDFLKLFPPTGTLNARVVTSPGHLKRMIEALKENLIRYETTFGEVKIADAPSQAIGFTPEK